MIYILGIILLIYPAIADFRKKSFYSVPIVIMTGLGLLIEIVWSVSVTYENLFGLIPGIVFMLISIVTKEAIGKGDAFVIMCLGVLIGWRAVCSICLLALLLSSLLGLFALIAGRADRKTTMPFVPFLLAAAGTYGVMCI